MDPTQLNIIIAVLAVFIAGYALWRSHRAGEALAPAMVMEALRESEPLAQDLAEVAMTGVQAAEQLYRTGKITQDARFDKAYAYVMSWFPESQLSQVQVVMAIESAVFVVNTLVKSIPRQSTPVPYREPSGGGG